MKLSWIFIITLLVFVAIFSVQNAEPMTVHFLGWQFAMSAALVIQLAALLGGLVGLVCGAWSRRSSRRPERAVPPAAVGPANPEPLEKDPGQIERFN